MIFGIGTDLATVQRFAEMLERHGRRALERVLAPAEIIEADAVADRARFLAKRFAAKEALGKALGTGVRDPVLLTAITVTHDALGKPGFAYSAELAEYIEQRRLSAHLSLSDEGDKVLAFVVVEQA